jgi:glycosyltransferase involved in cell wall biosynthesis
MERFLFRKLEADVWGEVATLPANSVKPIIIVSSLEELGGTERVAILLYLRLRVIFPQIRIIVLGGDAGPLTGCKGVVLIQGGPSVRLFCRLAYFLKSTDLRDVILLGFSELSNTFLGMLRLLRLIRAPLVLRCSTIISLSRPGRAAALRRLLTALTYRQADRLVCQSEAMRSSILAEINIPKEKIQIIFNPFLGDVLNSDYQPNAIPGGGEPYILIIANFRPEKGHERFLKMYSLCGSRIKIVLLSPERSHQKIKRLLTEFGICQRAQLFSADVDVMSVLRGAVALVIPSYYEGYPNVAVEAAFAGVPIIGFRDCAVLREIIVPGETGEFIDESNPDSLSFAIKQCQNLPLWTPKRRQLLNRHKPEVFEKAYLDLLCMVKNEDNHH